MSLLITVHIIACGLLIIIILIQTGRGGGLVDSLSNVESMFGTKTSLFLTRTTGILAILFFLTCISLAFLSAKQSRSLLSGVVVKPAPAAQQEPAPQTPPVKQAQTLPAKQ